MKTFTSRLLAAFMLALCAMLAPQPTTAAPLLDDGPRITLSVRDVPLREFMAKVEQSTAYTFFYSSSVLENAGTVTVEAADEPLESLLHRVFDGSGRTFEIVGNKIAIKLASESKSAAGDAVATDATAAKAQNNAPERPHTVKGIVKDENGTPMGGVGVMIVGTLNGVITEADGRYTVSVTPSQELQFSFLGYKDETVKVGSRTEINVSMQNATQAMEQVVVTGTRYQARGEVARLCHDQTRRRPFRQLRHLCQLAGRSYGTGCWLGHRPF